MATALGARRRRWPLLAAGGALVLVVTAAGFLYLRDRPAGPSTALDSRRVVVAVFENQTGDRSLDHLGRMASDWITQGLSRVEGLEVAPSTAVLFAQAAGGRRAPAGGDPIRALAEATGAGTVVSGSYYLQGDTLEFQARVTDAMRGRLLHVLDPVSGSRRAPLEAIDALRQRVMGAVMANVVTVHEVGLQLEPPRYEAYREFIAGFEVFLTDDREALRHFERSVQLDSSFMVPLFYEAYIRDAAGDHTRVEAILRTLNNRREVLTAGGRDWLGMMEAYAAHRYPEALQHVRDSEKRVPRDPMVTLWIGILAKYSNRPREAVDAYDRFGPRPYAGHEVGVGWMNQLCGSLHMLGEHRRELDEAQRARASDPNQLELCAMEVCALAALGRIEQVNRDIDASLALSPTGGTPGDVMLEAAAELRVHGHRQASLVAAERAAAWYRGRLEGEPDNETWISGLVDALRWGERWDEAYDACRTLSEKAPQDPDHRGQLGCLAARLGKRDEAMRISAELQEMSGPYLFGAQTYRRACIAALLGEKQKAVELLRESFAEGVPYSIRHHREIDLEPLWDYPSFQELMRPKG